MYTMHILVKICINIIYVTINIMKSIFYCFIYISYCHEKIPKRKEPKEIRIHFVSHCKVVFYYDEVGTIAKPEGSFHIACANRK